MVVQWYDLFVVVVICYCCFCYFNPDISQTKHSTDTCNACRQTSFFVKMPAHTIDCCWERESERERKAKRSTKSRLGVFSLWVCVWVFGFIDFQKKKVFFRKIFNNFRILPKNTGTLRDTKRVAREKLILVAVFVLGLFWPKRIYSFWSVWKGLGPHFLLVFAFLPEILVLISDNLGW